MRAVALLCFVAFVISLSVLTPMTNGSQMVQIYGWVVFACRAVGVYVFYKLMEGIFK